jgi:hypothetical protein
LKVSLARLLGLDLGEGDWTDLPADRPCFDVIAELIRGLSYDVRKRLEKNKVPLARHVADVIAERQALAEPPTYVTKIYEVVRRSSGRENSVSSALRKFS